MCSLQARDAKCSSAVDERKNVYLSNLNHSLQSNAINGRCIQIN